MGVLPLFFNWKEESINIYTVVRIRFRWYSYCMNNNKSYIDIKELSSLWGVSRAYISVLCRHGKIIGAIKKGSKWYVPIEEARKKIRKNIRVE